MKRTRLCWKVDEEKEQGECKQAYYCVDIVRINHEGNDGFSSLLFEFATILVRSRLIHIRLSVNHRK